MPLLHVFQNGKKVFCLPLESRCISIGRAVKNDLILAGDGVSRTHALVEKRDDGYWIIDQSSLGTLVDGVRVNQELLLRNKSRIQIAQWQLLFVVDDTQDELMPLSAAATRLTKSIQTAQVDGTRLIQFAATDTIKTLRPLLIVDVFGAGKRHVNVKKRKLVIGSANDCDVVLDDSYVSKRHAEFVLSDQGFLVVDLDSTNGTFIGGAKIKECYLKRDQEIVLGRSKILVTFENDEPVSLNPVNTGQFCGIMGESQPMRLLFAKIELAARSEMTTLVLGETGSGKEMVARALHDLSARHSKPYVIINCGAISPSLIESELFGHEKGAFTGADARHIGAFEQASGGSLFLDEVGELPLELQSKILRVLEYQTLRRVGGVQEIKIDVRLIAATHRDLMSMVANQKFREDLFYRLYVLPLKVPALRERCEDIPMLANYFLAKMASDRGLVLTDEALAKLQDHDWPGNVRELKNTLMRALAFCVGSKIEAGDIETIKILGCDNNVGKVQITESPAGLLQPGAVDQFEKERILQAIQAASGDKNEAAKKLGMGRSTLFRKMKELGLTEY